MLYREAGQFKTTYKADSQIFPILQDRVGMMILLSVAAIGVPLFASEYWINAILIPFLIFSLAALGLNFLTGYAGQLSLGSAAFMAVGAFATYNFQLRIEGIPFFLSFIRSRPPVRPSVHPSVRSVCSLVGRRNNEEFVLQN